MEDKKNAMMPIVVGVITLLVLVIGATYAYFAVGLSNNFGTTTINATTENVGTVTLSNINSTLSMNVTAADMMHITRCVKQQCDQNEENCEWVPCQAEEAGCACSMESLPYYATPTGKSTVENMEWEIGRATVTPNNDTNYYSCDYTLGITTSGTMYTAFNNMPTMFEADDNAYKSDGQVVFQINDRRYDWYTDGMPSTYSGNMIVTASSPASITAGLKLVNHGMVNQTALAGTNVSIAIQATTFSCSAVPVTYGYYNHTNWNNGTPTIASTPGNMGYYIKQTIINSVVYSNELCGVFNGTEVCFKANDWENHATYYSQLSAIDDVRVGYSNSNDEISARYGSVTCIINSSVDCTDDGHGCSITSAGVISCD